MPGASHAAVTRGARPGRILLAAQQVMLLRKVHDSDIGDFVSHPNLGDYADRHGDRQTGLSA